MNTSLLLTHAAAQFQRLKGSLSLEVQKQIADRLDSFEDKVTSLPAALPPTSILVRRPGVPPRPLPAAFFRLKSHE